MQTTMIRASMTAYSTAVGPSSAFRNFTTPRFRFDNMRHSSFRLVLTKGPPQEKRAVTTDKGGSCNPGLNVAPSRLLGGLTFRQPGDPSLSPLPCVEKGGERGTHGFAPHP